MSPTRSLAFLATVLAAQAFAEGTNAPPQVTLASPVELRALTPLGEAAIAVSPGETAQVLATENGQLRVSRGPFAAWISPAAIATPSPSPPASPQPSAAPAPPPSHPSPWVQAAKEIFAQMDPALLVGAAVLAALLALAIALGVVLGRFRRLERSLRKLQENGARPPQQENTADPTGITVPCPHCEQALPPQVLREGRGTCPSCGGAFACE